MAWTLWRGDTLLGTLHDRSAPASPRTPAHGERHVNAVLLPDPAYLPLPSVRQRVVTSIGTPTVVEHSREPDVAGDPLPSESQREPAEVAFVVSQEQSLSQSMVPRERQLHVHDDEDQAVPAHYISIQEYRPQPSAPPADLATLPRGAYVGGSIWLVAFTYRWSAT